MTGVPDGIAATVSAKQLQARRAVAEIEGQVGFVGTSPWRCSCDDVLVPSQQRGQRVSSQRAEDSRQLGRIRIQANAEQGSARVCG